MPQALAAGEFVPSYNVTYEVAETGSVSVLKKIVLKNLTDQYFASSFNLSVSAVDITDITASDSQGPLEVNIATEGRKTKINIKLSQQIVGKGKEYSFTLKYKSKDFVQKIGKVWNINIPKIASQDNLESYNTVLSVPVSFGDPSSIMPEPIKQTEDGRKLNLFFSKEQLKDSGIFANFGDYQVFKFNLLFSVVNDKVLPEVVRISLPADGPYQRIAIRNIEPKPENVTLDFDGNYLAWFKLDRQQIINVKVEGLGRVALSRFGPLETLSDGARDKYTSTQEFWDKDNPIIKNKLVEIFKDKQPVSNQEKARLIYQFVSSYLEYNSSRLKEDNLQRLGALAALANPAQALCSEYADLFVTLARSAGIPARMLTGFAYSSNVSLRPLSLQNDFLHAWVEYYDPALGWKMADPTWGSTTGGADYFSNFDLNHLVLAVRGSSSKEPVTPAEAEIRVADEAFVGNVKLKVTFDSPAQVLATFPAQAKIRVENQGQVISSPVSLSLTSAKINITGDTAFTIPPIPPLGFLEYEFDLRTAQPWESYEDILQLKIGEEIIDKKIQVKPLFAYKIFFATILGTILGIVVIYLVILFFHLKSGGIRFFPKSKKRSF